MVHHSLVSILQAPETQEARRRQRVEADHQRFNLGRAPLSRKFSETSPKGGIVSLKLSSDGYLKCDDSDIKIEVTHMETLASTFNPLSASLPRLIVHLCLIAFGTDIRQKSTLCIDQW